MVDLQGQFVVKRIIITTNIFTGNGTFSLITLFLHSFLCILKNISKCVAVKNPMCTFSEHRLGHFSTLAGKMFEGNHLTSPISNNVSIFLVFWGMEIYHPVAGMFLEDICGCSSDRAWELSVCELVVYGGKLYKDCLKYTILIPKFFSKLQIE